ncbi:MULTISPECIES: LytTR family DNA-binding domain-containing protein [unclassified Caulobacter]|uniref:LytTR family DNA-binding domain-containing protein n=1 Tax=unclassified Caulobacter TaxID=2648921 RepID=UPI000AC4404F|nr:LytTR family DNA-binding domain-containing protein [Caulobacter sp. UNC358MFTsu5.1]
MTDLRAILQRGGADLALLLAMGLFLGAVGPFGSEHLAPRQAYAYWVLCIVGGGLIGILIDETVGRRAGVFWRRLLVTAVLMTPPTALWVLVSDRLVVGAPIVASRYWPLLWQVFLISVPVMAVRALVWRRPSAVVETRVVVEPPLPEAEAAFRRRLSAKRRGARLIAVEADDHYLRVHTDAGAEMVTLRFAVALDELSGAHGFQTHRSWWVAAEAVEGVRWRRGGGELRLAGGLAAPVSRTHAPTVKAAGWF